MPTSNARAARWVKSGKATPFWRKGIWCVRLNHEPSARNTQPVAIGVDPGSKREGFTVKSAHGTFLNVQTKTVDWVKKKLESRRNLRRSRRNRKTPCRKPRWANRNRENFLPPSTRARWQWKLRVISWLQGMFPVTDICVEDVCAVTKKGAKKWNSNFSPVQAGKNWFYSQLVHTCHTRQGWETHQLRQDLGLRKSGNKLSEKFNAHCVDSWVLANSIVGGHLKPDNEHIVFVEPIKKHYRNLHMQNPAKGGLRRRQGSTRSMGFERGSIVTHPKYGECLVGGTSKGRVTLNHKETGNRLCQNAKPEHIRFRCFNSFLVRSGNSSPRINPGVSLPNTR